MIFVYAIINGGGDSLDLVNPSRFEGLFKKTLPKTVRLYTINSVIGETANIKPKRGCEEHNKISQHIKNGIATIIRENEAKTIPIETTVTPFRSKDIIYIGLQENDHIERGLHLLKQVNKLLTCSWPLYSLRNIVSRNI